MREPERPLKPRHGLGQLRGYVDHLRQRCQQPSCRAILEFEVAGNQRRFLTASPVLQRPGRARTAVSYELLDTNGGGLEPVPERVRRTVWDYRQVSSNQSDRPALYLEIAASSRQHIKHRPIGLRRERNAPRRAQFRADVDSAAKTH